MTKNINIVYILGWFYRLYRRLARQRGSSIPFLLNIVLIFLLLYLYLTSTLQLSTTDKNIIGVHIPFNDLIPSNRFDLFWTIWNTEQSKFRGRRLLVLESLFIHHPHVTVIMLSPTLNDTKLFQPFRQRGYRIYSFNISINYMLQWNWYLTKDAKEFLQNWNSSSIYFYSHLSDYLRAIVLYLYGGTYMDLDALILQKLPNEEFIGYDRSGAGNNCLWCVKNTSGLYLAPGFMRFYPYRTVFRNILQQTFNNHVYNESCFNCVGPKAFTKFIIQHRNRNDSELINLKLFESYRLYPFMWTETLSIFHDVKQDTSLQLIDLMKRSYSIHLFGHMSDRYSISQGSLIDLLFDKFDLGDLRPKIPNRDKTKNNFIRLIYPSIYIYTHRKQGQFIGHDIIYFRLNRTLANEYIRWNISIYVSNGTIILSYKNLFNLNQAQINIILNEISYKPYESTSIDTLIIHIKNENVFINCSLKILIFSKWVTILTKTMGTYDRWPVIQRLVTSVEKYFPQTNIRIASDSGDRIDKNDFLNFTSINNINGYDLINNIFIYNMPEDSGLSLCRNYLLKKTMTPFFFILDDDFEFEEDSHLDLLLELIYTYQHIDIIAGKIPEDIKVFHDYSGIFLYYNQTLELRKEITDDCENNLLYARLLNEKLDEINPCYRVHFVPNVFMGRTKTVRSIGWNNDFKLGEHEDFFLRFAQANRTVYTCRYIHTHHHQIPWWTKIHNPYYKKRARVYEYYKKMLMEHNLKRIITFGLTNMDLDKIH